MNFEIHTTETAPENSQDALQAIEERYGFIPNLAAVFAESPGAFNALLAALKAYDDPSLTLTPVERQVVLLAVSVENRCDYCTAAHGMLAHSLGLDRDDIVALQQGRAIRDSKLEALREFTRSLVANRGLIDETALTRFADAGFSRAQVLEVILGVSLKTLTNYANHVANPPVNEQFRAFLPEWAARTGISQANVRTVDDSIGQVWDR